MNLVDIYEYLLFILVTIFTFSQCRRYEMVDYDGRVAESYYPDTIGLLLCIFFTFLIGLRPLGNDAWQWADSANYEYTYNLSKGTPFVFNWLANNKIWDNLFDFWASKDLGLTCLFLIGDAIYFGCTYAACRKWFPNDTTVAYLAFLGAFSTYSYSYNGVKAGIAAGIFLLALAYYENKVLSIALVLISWGFHHSMELPVGAYILTLFYKNPKWYFYGWAICVLMAVLHITVFQGIFVGMDDTTEKYLGVTEGQEEFGGTGGFRIDFLLYSAVPIWIGYNIVMKEGRDVSPLYSAMLHIYLCANACWCLCMYASYCNRIAYLSWFIYPFVLIYPFLKEDLTDCELLRGQPQFYFFTKVFKYHLYFTLFMYLIFFEFIK